MKKIMFNDKYGLTQAVLDGRKTMTRRLIPQSVLESVDQFRVDYYNDTFDALSFKDGIEQMLYVERNLKIPFRIQDEVAIAQNYDFVYTTFINHECYKFIYPKAWETIKKMYESREVPEGWDNKMFVRAELMPHRIKITGLRVEQLQDITDEDCLKEGIYVDDNVPEGVPRYKYIAYSYDAAPSHQKKKWWFTTPREAFAKLIDKVSGKGTWDSNPCVLCYEFELIR